MTEQQKSSKYYKRSLRSLLFEQNHQIEQETSEIKAASK